MQAVAVLAAGMLLIGSMLLHFKRFKWSAAAKAGKVAAFVYVSLIAGLFLFDFNSVMAFQTAFIKRWVYDPAQGSIQDMWLGLTVLFSCAIAIILTVSLIIQLRGSQSEWLTTIDALVFSSLAWVFISQGSFPTNVVNWLLTTTGGNIITFSLLVLAIGALNTVFGVIFVGLNMSLLVIQLAKGQALNLFSLLGLLELAHTDGTLIVMSMMLITTGIGALEFAIQHFDFGASHL